MTALGDVIRQFRTRAGLSQTDLAGGDFSASYVSLIESGKRQPSEEALAAFARRLGCSVDDLRTADGDDAATELELAYARLALANGEPEAARPRLLELLRRPALMPGVRHEAQRLVAESWEKSGDLDAAISALKPVYDDCVAGRSPAAITPVAVQLCWYCMSSGDFDAAVRVAEEGLRASSDAGLGHTQDHLKLQANLVVAHFELGNEAVALAVVDDLLRQAQESGSPFAEAAAYWNAAVLAESRGRLHEALQLSQRALALMGEQGSSRNLIRLQYTVAWLILRADPVRAWEAASLLDRSAPGLADLGSAVETGYWEGNRGTAQLLTGDAKGAERLLRRAILHLGDAGDEVEMAQATVTLGDALVAQDRVDVGVACYHDAARRLARLSAGWKVASVYRSIAYRLGLAGDADGAVAMLEAALDARGVQGPTATADVAFGLREPAPAPESSVHRSAQPETTPGSEPLTMGTRTALPHSVHEPS